MCDDLTFLNKPGFFNNMLKKGETMKLKTFKNWKILNKILCISVVTIALLIAGVVFYVLPYMERSLMDEKLKTTQGVVESVATLIQGHSDGVKKGTITLEEAKARSLEEIRGMRYFGNEYFFVIDMDAKILMHPIRPELNGTSGIETRDPNGKQIFVEMVKIAKEKEAGGIGYQWAKPGATKPVDKVSYVKLMKEWGWVVGSGIYVDDVKTQVAAMRWKILGGTLVLAFTIFLFAWFVARRIKSALDKAINVSEKIASGDLTTTIEADTEDETGQLLASLKVMNSALAEIVDDVRGGADSIATAAEQISAGNADLSQRTEEQASALEETASSMEELTSTVKQNADNAQQANQLAVSASDIAVKGGEVISKVVTTMGSITESSRKISDIIGVIDGIAFQTNILALNAAVEAARAGEQGRGFAVVAAEVRSLAQRSAAAAKEIKALIEDSVGKVENGSMLVEEAGSTTREIVTSIKKVADIMAEISAASIEQSSGIEQVNTAITQMDDVTQQNAALVEEAAAAAESLEDQAQGLVEVVSRFKLTDAGENAGAAIKPARRGAPEAKPVQKPVARLSSAVKPAARRKGAQDFSLSNDPVLQKAVGFNDDDWKEF